MVIDNPVPPPHTGVGGVGQQMHRCQAITSKCPLVNALHPLVNVPSATEDSEKQLPHIKGLACTSAYRAVGFASFSQSTVKEIGIIVSPFHR